MRVKPRLLGILPLLILAVGCSSDSELVSVCEIVRASSWAETNTLVLLRRMQMCWDDHDDSWLGPGGYRCEIEARSRGRVDLEARTVSYAGLNSGDSLGVRLVFDRDTVFFPESTFAVT